MEPSPEAEVNGRAIFTDLSLQGIGCHVDVQRSATICFSFDALSWQQPLKGFEQSRTCELRVSREVAWYLEAASSPLFFYSGSTANIWNINFVLLLSSNPFCPSLKHHRINDRPIFEYFQFHFALFRFQSPKLSKLHIWLPPMPSQ